jgi:predicted nucleic acid-binding protein
LSALLDTSVLSQSRKAAPDPDAMRWLRTQSTKFLFLSAITIHEVRQGIELAPAGAKRHALEVWLTSHVLPGFAGQILPIDAEIAEESARLVVRAKKNGHTAELADALIAATAVVHGLKLATLNRRHFERLGVELAAF